MEFAGFHHLDPPPEQPCTPPTSSSIPGLSCLLIERHGEGINMVFLDWSVRKVGLKGLWTLKWHAEYDTAGPWTKAGGVKPEDWPAWMRGFREY
jgi:prepilin-type processing-associated H-X9-DG protein